MTTNKEIFRNALDVLDNAENLDDSVEYVKLLNDIISECSSRIRRCITTHME